MADKINPSSLPSSQLSTPASTTQASNEVAGNKAHVGQTFTATVQNIPSRGNIELNIQGQTVNVNTDLKLTVGQQLQVAIAKIDSELTLNILKINRSTKFKH